MNTPPAITFLIAAASDAAEATPGGTAPPGGDGAGDLLVLWGILLIAAAMVLFFTEVFVPSGGLIALAGAVSLVFGIVLLFRVDSRLGLAGALITLVALPFIVAFGLKIWPDLPWVKGLILADEQKAVSAADTEEEDATGSGRPTVGATGEALTELRPVGMCRFGDHRAECLSAEGMIEPGDTVRVVAADGMQIKVKREVG